MVNFLAEAEMEVGRRSEVGVASCDQELKNCDLMSTQIRLESWGSVRCYCELECRHCSHHAVGGDLPTYLEEKVQSGAVDRSDDVVVRLCEHLLAAALVSETAV